MPRSWWLRTGAGAHCVNGRLAKAASRADDAGARNPQSLLRRLLRAVGFRIVRETLCVFPLTYRLHWFLKEPVFNYRWVVRWDRVLSALFAWNLRYHATNLAQKLRPAAAFYVLTKPG